MNSLLRKHLLCSSSSSAGTLLIRLQACELSSSSPPPHQWKRAEEDSRNVKVSVWWDFKNCHVPPAFNASKIAPAIMEAVRAKGIKGPLTITAFGDVQHLSRPCQEALAYTGIRFTHVSNDGRNSVDILADLMYWVSQNPPPAHLFLISGDRDFAGVLHRLRMNNYNILLATPEKAPGVLCSAATIAWQWSSLIQGEDLTGKHFNHPPDGPIGSWYGSFKVPLEKPTVAQQSIPNVQVYEPSLESKSRSIPKSVVRQVKHILSLHPQGISITDFRAELAKCDMCLDKNLYGHKSFSRFLLSMPFVQLQSLGNGNFYVQWVPSESKSIGESVDGESSFPSPVERNAQQSEIQLPPQDSKASKTKVGSFKLTSLKLSDNDIVRSEDASNTILEKHTTSGIHSAGNDNTTVENNAVANYESGNFKAENTVENSTRKGVDEVCHSPYSSPISDSPVDKRPGGSAETYSKSPCPTFFNWIRSWWPFWKTNVSYDNLTAHENKVDSHVKDSMLSEDQTVSNLEEPKLSEQDQNVGSSGKPELFSSVSFWNDMESFVFAPKGSLLFSQSRSREDMAHKLQNDGPLVLSSLTEKDILQLVELLITEKKWLEEGPSLTFPFRLIQPVQKDSFKGLSHGANGLRSLFLSGTSQSNLQKSFEHEVKKHNQSTPHARVSAPATETKYTEKSRNDILEDCQKLVSEILREHPEGYNIGAFRKLFVDRYGYHLDIQKLGYKKLASLLQIMPGVKLESTYIFPSVCASDLETSILKNQVTHASHTVSNSDGESSDPAPRYESTESSWEELGPVSVNNSNQSDLDSKLSQKAKELDTSKHPDYEPIVSDDDYSESEGDCSCLTQPKEQEKPKCTEQDSSFWQALDLWHSRKEGENHIKKSDKVNDLGNSLADILNSSTEITRGSLPKIPSGYYREKQRSQKNYLFVADPVSPNKDKLIDGILDGFSKADESKMQN